MNYKITEILTNKKQYIELLLIGDEQEDMIDRYLDQSRMFVLSDSDKEVKCTAVILELNADECELKNIAVYPQYQGKGYGQAMVKYLLKQFLGRYKTMLVGTGNVPKAIRFYEKCGFRQSHRIKNFFLDHYNEPIVEDGIQLCDMIYLRADA